ncbi:MAG: MsnO8 family LLM class oxidoreductase [Polyangiaceae bacterium]
MDLGLGRAAGTDPRTASLLRRSAPSLRAGDEFPDQMNELLSFFEDDGPPREAFARTVRAAPIGVPTPKIWILGSSEYGGAYAAKNGFGFAFAHHINPVDAVVTMKRYRADFQPSAYCETPHAILAVSSMCADDEAMARELKEIAAFSGLLFALGLRDIPLPSLAEAREHVWGDDDRALAEASKSRGFVGTSKDVAERLKNLARECQADELMVMSNTHDHDARKKSYTLLANAFTNR